MLLVDFTWLSKLRKQRLFLPLERGLSWKAGTCGARSCLDRSALKAFEDPSRTAQVAARAKGVHRVISENSQKGVSDSSPGLHIKFYLTLSPRIRLSCASCPRFLGGRTVGTLKCAVEELPSLLSMEPRCRLCSKQCMAFCSLAGPFGSRITKNGRIQTRPETSEKTTGLRRVAVSFTS